MSDITITHDHQNGTILTGSSKGDGAYEIVKPHGFTWRPEPGIFIRGSRDRDAQEQRIGAAAQALRAAGHEVTVSIDTTSRTTAEREAARAQRAEGRAEYFARQAGRAEARSQAAEEGVRRIADHIPFGQPILVGHHSERRARRDQDRIESGMRKTVDEDAKARELARRADTASRSQEHRSDARVTMRRIEKLEAEGRSIARSLAGYRNNRGDVFAAVPPGTETHTRLTSKAASIAEEIAYWRSHLAAHADAGTFVPWGPEHFVAGDRVRARERWHKVRRVNRKSVSVPWIVGGMATGEESKHTDTIPWDDVSGRRRDGMQLDQPNGEPWPVEDAVRVARWRGLVRSMSLPSSRYSDEARNTRAAQRIAHGLPFTASDAELDAFPVPADVEGRRAYALAYLAVFERLAAGERAADVAASTEPIGDTVPAWRMPDGEPVKRRLDQLVPGDLVKGFFDRGRGLDRSFCGPVETVGAIIDRSERGTFRVLTLDTGRPERIERRFPTYMWFAVYPVWTWETAAPLAVNNPKGTEVAASVERSAVRDPWGTLVAQLAATRAV